MSLANDGYRTSRWNDFGWGMNVRYSSDAIDDKQSVMCLNTVSEWNKLITIPWYTNFVELGSGIKKGQAITMEGEYVLTLNNRNLYIYNTTTWTTYTSTNVVWDATSTYKIITTKSFASWKLSIVILNTYADVTEDIKAVEFDWTTFSFPTFTSLSNKNFKCGTFYEGKLWLWGNPAFPSSLYTSRTGSVGNPTYIYNFSAYDSTSQNIWDWAAIVNITTNNSQLFVVKTNSSWNLVGTQDAGWILAYRFSQVSSTWALNTHCVLPVEQDILYFDGTSLRRMSYEMNLSALKDDNISEDIMKVIDELPDEQTKNATMWYAYPYAKLSLRDKFSTNNSITIIYNVVDKSYSIQSGLDVVQWVGGFLNSKRVAYFVSSQWAMVYQDNVWNTYNGWNIQVSNLSKRYVLWDGVDYKRISQVELYGKISPWLNIFIDVYVNWVVVDTREIYYSEVLLPTLGSANLGNTMIWANNEEGEVLLRDYVVRYEYFNDWRDYQLWIRSNWQWKFELHWMNVMYKFIRAYDLH